MAIDRLLLWLAQVFYATSCVLTIRRLRAGGDATRLHRTNYVSLIAGFVLHTAFLVLRGRAVQSCPLTNLFEVNAFIAWAAVLFFLLIGTSYRVSFLGAFTAPVAFVLCATGLLFATDVPRAEPVTRNPWIEFHAAIAILACGAFALAFVTGVMYLVQERQLKSRHLSPSFLLLPSIEQLDVINFRLLMLGFVMLSLGMVGGVVSYRIVGHWTKPKIVWAVATWLIYAGLLLAHRVWSWRGRRVALGAMASFAFVLITFWGVSLLGKTP